MKSTFSSILASAIILMINHPVYSQDHDFECGSNLLDRRDGREYPTIMIGTQCWMAKNLDIGERISLLKDQRDNGIIEKYCYDNDDEVCFTYGGLYQWDEMMQFDSLPGARGICPEGWHIPDDEEWCILATYLDSTVDCSAFGPTGEIAGSTMRTTGILNKKTGMWFYPNREATNKSGFSAVPAGTRSIYSKFFYLGYHGYFWSSTQESELQAWFWYLKYSNTAIYRESYFKRSGYSVRCLKD
jgi:uncharacterized protein (TIGR02145 family)